MTSVEQKKAEKAFYKWIAAVALIKIAVAYTIHRIGKAARG